MTSFPFICAFMYLLLLNFTTATTDLDTSVRVRTPPGRSERDVYEAVRRGLGRAANHTAGFHYKVNETLDRSWNGAVLLSLGEVRSKSFGPSEGTHHSELEVSTGVEIVCTTCYIKGFATGELTMAGGFNASRIYHQAIYSVEDNLRNFTTYVEDWTDKAFDNFTDETFGEHWYDVTDWDLDIEDYELPTFDYDFNMKVPAMPEASLCFTFDDLELYMELDTTLSLYSTYTLNLYTSPPAVGPIPIGFKVSDDFLIGVVFTIDLILTASGFIDISSGFHIKLEDGLAIDFELFGKDASGITFNGGQFESLPVTVESAGMVFTVVLRVGVTVGFDVELPGSSISSEGLEKLDFSAGLQVGAFAHVAEFTTNVSYASQDAECDLAIEQMYTFALGAAAGATVAVLDHTWGPSPETTKPIFYTTLASACALQPTPKTTAPSNYSLTAPLNRRDGMSTATVTRDIVRTGVNCLSKGMINCPASLQNTTTSAASTTFTAVVSSGTDEEDIPLPSPYHTAVTTTATFGEKAVKLPVSTGVPVSYIPPPPPKPTGNITTHDILPDNLTGFDRKMIIGLSVALGMSVLIALVLTSLFIHQKRRVYHAVPKGEAVAMFAKSYASGDYAVSSYKPGRAEMRVAEVRPLAETYHR